VEVVIQWWHVIACALAYAVALLFVVHVTIDRAVSDRDSLRDQLAAERRMHVRTVELYEKRHAERLLNTPTRSKRSLDDERLGAEVRVICANTPPSSLRFMASDTGEGQYVTVERLLSTIADAIERDDRGKPCDS